MTQKQNDLQQWYFQEFSKYSPLLSKQNCSSFWKALWYSKRDMTWSCEFTALARSWIHKNFFPAGQFSKWKTARTVGWVGQNLYLFSLQIVNCGEQHCRGLTMFLRFPRLAAAPGQPQQLLAVRFLASGHCCLLRQNADHQGASMVEKYSEEPLMLWNRGLRTTGLSAASSIHTTFAYFDGMP